MSDLFQNSASQIATFDDTKEGCQRKWAWGRIARIRSPQGVGAALGEEIHKQIEDYLGGKPLDFTKPSGYIVSSGLEFIPKPGTPGLVTERQFHFEFEKASYMGRMDCEIPSVVHDWKSTKNFKYRLSKEELRKDPQAILYACDYFRRHPTELEVKCSWVYLRTEGAKKSVKTEITITQEEAAKGLEALEKISERMAGIYDAAPPLQNTPEAQKRLSDYILSLSPNENSCSAFGGCPHRGRCTDLDPLKQIFSKHAKKTEETKKNMSILNKMRGATAPVAATPKVVEPQQINPPEQHLPVAAEFVAQPMPTPTNGATPPKGGLLSRVKASLAGASVPAPSPAPAVLVDEVSFHERYPDVNPADLTAEQIARVNAGQPPTPFHSAPAPVEVPVSVPAPPATVPEIAPKKRGRPKKVVEETPLTVAATLAMEEAYSSMPVPSMDVRFHEYLAEVRMATDKFTAEVAAIAAKYDVR